MSQPFKLVLLSVAPDLPSQLSQLPNRDFNIISFFRKEDSLSALNERSIDVAILDLELFSLEDVKQLCRQLPKTAFICTHRLADDEMWMKALTAGAEDCCRQDAVTIADSVHRALARAHAAAA